MDLAAQPKPLAAGRPLRYLARQPILDRQERVFGYELLFRGGPETLWSAVNSDRASLSTMDYSLVFGTGTLTGGKRAFINCTRELLVDGLVTLLPPDSTVLEILEDVEPEPEVIKACHRLRSLGYILAMDDFDAEDMDSAFLDLATYIKVDLRATSRNDQATIAQRLSRRGLILIAEKVETRDEFEFASGVGYQFFQGYFFCKPTIVSTHEIPSVQRNQLRLLQAASDPTLDLHALEQIIRPDVSLCYRLLRYLNSAAFGLYPVRSIHHALTLLGEREIRKWIALVSAAMLAKSKTPELARMAIVRAKFCETYAASDQRENYFLAGLFSLLDAMLERPMEQLVGDLPIPDECRAALLGNRNRLFELLQLCELCEKGEFDETTQDSDGASLWDTFHSAVTWSDAVIGATLLA